MSSHIKQAEQDLRKLASEATPAAQTVVMLGQLKGVGLVTSQVLGYEFFGWRRFSNGRQVGALAGLTGTPHQSGTMDREQGISKAGNRRVRAVMTELAWNWVRFQKESALTQWFTARFAGGPGRMRRIGVIALARKLLVALWRFVDQGVVPAGAILSPPRN